MVDISKDDRAGHALKDAAELLWLVERAKAIRHAKGWTKEQRERSWKAWDEHADSVLEKRKP